MGTRECLGSAKLARDKPPCGRKSNNHSSKTPCWNKFMLKRGWRDEDDGSTQELLRYKASSGLSDRNDILTFFDYYEVDEGRKP